MNSLKDIQDIPFQQRVCIFGAGQCGVELLSLLEKSRKDISVIFFVDSFATGDVSGKKIYAPSQLHSLREEIDIIIVSSRSEEFCSEISSFLVKERISNYYFLHPLFGENIQVKDNGLYAVYDLSVSPCSFDVITFLCMAEVERIKLKCNYMHVIIIPPEHDRYGDKENVNWRIRNLLLPCCWLMPSCRDATICSSRGEASPLLSNSKNKIFPFGYSIENPVAQYLYYLFKETCSTTPSFPTLKATNISKTFVSEWITYNQLHGKKIISITLREYGKPESRNSNLREWIRFARNLDTEIYAPVFIRDTFCAFTLSEVDFGEFLCFQEVPWNMELRMALYEECYLNMFSTGGPPLLCVMNSSTRYLIFKIHVEGELVASSYLLNSFIVPLGGQFVNSSKLRRIVWDDDSYESIMKEFDVFVKDAELLELDLSNVGGDCINE